MSLSSTERTKKKVKKMKQNEKKLSLSFLTSVREEHVEHGHARPHPPVVLEQPRRRRAPVRPRHQRRHHDADGEELRRRPGSEQLAHVGEVSGLGEGQAEEGDYEAEMPLREVLGVARGVLEGLRCCEVEDDASDVVGWGWSGGGVEKKEKKKSGEFFPLSFSRSKKVERSKKVKGRKKKGKKKTHREASSV